MLPLFVKLFTRMTAHSLTWKVSTEQGIWVLWFSIFYLFSKCLQHIPFSSACTLQMTTLHSVDFWGLLFAETGWYMN